MRMVSKEEIERVIDDLETQIHTEVEIQQDYMRLNISTDEGIAHFEGRMEAFNYSISRLKELL